MEAAVVWKTAMKPRLPTRLGKRCAFPTAPTAPAAKEKQARRTSRDAEGNLQNLTYTTTEAASRRQLRLLANGSLNVCRPRRAVRPASIPAAARFPRRPGSFAEFPVAHMRFRVVAALGNQRLGRRRNIRLQSGACVRLSLSSWERLSRSKAHQTPNGFGNSELRRQLRRREGTGHRRRSTS